MEIKVWILVGVCGFLVTLLMLGVRLFLKRFDTQITLLGEIKSTLAVQKTEGKFLRGEIQEIKEEQKEHSDRIRKLEINRGASA